MAFAFEQLQVYQKALEFADAVCLRTVEARMNVKVACPPYLTFTMPDRKNFFGIARGSAQECVPLLELANRQSLLETAKHQQLKDDLEEIARMLSGLINGLDNRKT